MGESRAKRVVCPRKNLDLPAGHVQSSVQIFEGCIQVSRLREPGIEIIEVRHTGCGEVWRNFICPAGVQSANGLLRFTAPASDANGGEVGNANLDIAVRFDLVRLRN